ncbi:MAG: F0F1 ATP synthase subunit delta [Pseudomonadota bacterium]
MSAQAASVSGLAGRYATALFDLARENDALDPLAADLDALHQMLEASADLRRLIASPQVSRADQAGAIAALATSAAMHPLGQKFLGVLAHNRRLAALPAIIAAFRHLLAAHKGEITATVTAAQPLDAGQIEALKAKLKATLKAEVAVAVKVDEALLGGLVVKIGSRQIDSSIRSKLNRLKVAMKGAG